MARHCEPCRTPAPIQYTAAACSECGTLGGAIADYTGLPIRLSVRKFNAGDRACCKTCYTRLRHRWVAAGGQVKAHAKRRTADPWIPPEEIEARAAKVSRFKTEKLRLRRPENLTHRELETLLPDEPEPKPKRRVAAAASAVGTESNATAEGISR